MIPEHVTFMPCGGLANRLQNIISAIVFCNENGIIPDFVWVVHPEVGNGLFESYFTSDHRFVNVDRESADWMLKEHSRTDHARRTNQIVYYWGFTHSAAEDPDVAGYSRLVMGISHNFVKPKPEIQDIVDDFCSVNGVGNRVGIHVRDYEHNLDYSGNRVGSDLDLIDDFSTLMTERKDDFFLCSDSAYVRQTLSRRFSNLIYRTEDNTGTPFIPRDTIEGTTLGLIDFLILSKCKSIIGTRGSSFSHLAGLLGHIPISWVDCPRWKANKNETWTQGAYWKDGFYR